MEQMVGNYNAIARTLQRTNLKRLEIRLFLLISVNFDSYIEFLSLEETTIYVSGRLK